jgi:branched-chain amino acid transport system substrate-binding protein
MGRVAKFVAIVCASSTMTVWAVVAAHADDKPIIIGLATAKTGWLSAYDEDGAKALKLAVDDINAKGGLLGRQIKVVEADSKTDPQEAFKAATQVIQQGATFVIAPCDFDMGGPASLAAENSGILSMSICAGSPKFGPQGVGPLTYTISLTAHAEGVLLAEWAKKQGWDKPYVLMDTNLVYNRTQCGGFRWRWKAIAPDSPIVGDDSFKQDDPSIAAQISRIKATNPKPNVIVICAAGPGAVAAVRQLSNTDLGVPIIMGPAMDGNYWLTAVPNLSNFHMFVHGSVFGDDPNPAVNDLIDRFKKKYGTAPATSYPIMGYSVAQAYALAVTRAGTTDSAKVAAELDKFNNEQFLAGPRSYSKEVHIQLTWRALGMQVQNGKVSSTGEYYTTSVPVPVDMLFKE